ncbi:MAG: hypothetical protein LBB82_07590 [Treponema sp.]|jgi:hypothetical protein|nr:hypothetical protein [Treponema sp.]
MLLKHSIPKCFTLGILLFAYRQIYAADVAIGAIPDDTSLRLELKERWLTGSPQTVRRNNPSMHTLSAGGRVQVRGESRGNEFMVVFAREYNGAYPGWAQGSWVYFRALDSGDALRLRIFPRSDPTAYLQLQPLSGDKCRLDMVIQEAYLVRGLALGIPFERLLTMPLSEVFRAAGDQLPLRYFDIDSARYADSRSFVSKVRGGLGALEFRDDGAVDENGNYVFIESLEPQGPAAGLNCSGFAKWIVDGILRPVTGRRLAITPLKAPAAGRTSSLTENFSGQDPLFGLDWTRNLALEAARVLRGNTASTLEEVEVRTGRFASTIDRERGGAVIRNYPAYLSGAGFSPEGLRALLYTLAVDEPNVIYLASVSEEGSVPRMRRHYHIAVLVPYFSANGVFQIAVFESAEETAINGFIGRHPNALINLVRVPVEGSFSP